jgi:hypothetical protein
MLALLIVLTIAAGTAVTILLDFSHSNMLDTQLETSSDNFPTSRVY